MSTTPVTNRTISVPFEDGQTVRLLVDGVEMSGRMRAGEVGYIVDVTQHSNGQHGYAVVPTDSFRHEVNFFTHSQLEPHHGPFPPSPSLPPSSRVLTARPVNALAMLTKAPKES